MIILWREMFAFSLINSEGNDMKKNIRFFYLGVMVMICLIACGFTQKNKAQADATAFTVNVEFEKSALLSGNAVNLYIDGNEIGKIKAGSTEKFEVSLTPGKHEIWAMKDASDEKSSSAKVKFSTDKSTVSFKLVDDSDKGLKLTEAAVSTDEILRRAKARSGAPMAELDSTDENGDLVIHLYEVVTYEGEGSHTSTWDWYYINPTTLKGTDFMGDPVDLNK